MGSRKPFTFHSELLLAVGVLSVMPSVATAGACRLCGEAGRGWYLHHPRLPSGPLVSKVLWCVRTYIAASVRDLLQIMPVTTSDIIIIRKSFQGN